MRSNRAKIAAHNAHGRKLGFLFSRKERKGRKVFSAAVVAPTVSRPQPFSEEAIVDDIAIVSLVKQLILQQRVKRKAHARRRPKAVPAPKLCRHRLGHHALPCDCAQKLDAARGAL
jgi:hypothetical protein